MPWVSAILLVEVPRQEHSWLNKPLDAKVPLPSTVVIVVTIGIGIAVAIAAPSIPKKEGRPSK